VSLVSHFYASLIYLFRYRFLFSPRSVAAKTEKVDPHMTSSTCSLDEQAPLDLQRPLQNNSSLGVCNNKRVRCKITDLNGYNNLLFMIIFVVIGFFAVSLTMSICLAVTTLHIPFFVVWDASWIRDYRFDDRSY
jgi:hypothetical protein